MGSVKPVGAPFLAGSCDSDRCVLAMQMGSSLKPCGAAPRRAGQSAVPGGDQHRRAGFRCAGDIPEVEAEGRATLRYWSEVADQERYSGVCTDIS